MHRRILPNRVRGPRAALVADLQSRLPVTAAAPPRQSKGKMADTAAGPAQAVPHDPYRTAMAVFFISDTHFGDHRVLNLYPRPFASVAAMDAEMIARWNAVVGDQDEVWHLGDFARTAAQAAAILPRLAGRKHLVLGNNDPPPDPGTGWLSAANYG